MESGAKIFVAGHEGLVGSAILRHLKRSGFGCLVTRRRAELDLRDQAATRDFFRAERPDYVFLAAAKVGGILANSTFPVDFLRDNLLIELSVIEAAWRSGVTKLVFLGSSCIYPRLAPQPMKEEHLLTGPLETTNEWYAMAKIAGIRLCQAYRRQHGFDAISLIPTNLYGTGDSFDLESCHVLPALLRKLHLAKLAGDGRWAEIEADERRFGPLPEDVRKGLSAPGRPRVVLWGTGSPRRELLHVDDLAAAAVFLMERYSGEEIVNVGVGEDVTVRELASLAADAVDFRGEIVWDGSKPDGTPRKLLDVSRLKTLGWAPSVALRDGVAATYKWYLESGRH